MDARGLIQHVSNTTQRPRADPIRVLGLIRAAPRDRSALAVEFGVPRSTIHRGLAPFESAGFVSRVEGGLVVNGAGEVFLVAYEQALAVLDREDLCFLSGSVNRVSLLEHLGAEPARKIDLSSGEEAPSKTTVQRALRAFAEKGWTEACGSGYQRLTADGEEALAGYSALLVATEQAIRKAPLLEYLGELATSLPVEALAETDLIETSQANRDAILQASLAVAGGERESPARVATIVSVLSPVMYRGFEPLLEEGTRFRVVCDAKTYEGLQSPEHERYLRLVDDHPAIDMRVHPEALQFGVATYDDAVTIIAYPDLRTHEVGVVSRHPALVEWANGLVETYWEGAHAASGVERDEDRRPSAC